MNKVHIIGIGPGGEDYILPVAKRKVEESDCLLGAKRLVSLFKNLNKKEFLLEGHFDKAVSYIKKYKDRQKIAVLVSGDPGIYSFSRKISGILKPEEYAVIPGISAVQLAFARIGQCWEGVEIISLHGRRVDDLYGRVSASERLFLFMDAKFPPQALARRLLKDGSENKRAVVFKNLSYSDERIIDTDLKRLSRMTLSGLCVMIVQKKESESALKNRAKRASPGRFYGIGIGPGDPKLLTLKARQILSRADVIFVPKAGANSSSLARFIIEKAVPARKKFIELTFPMTKDKCILERYWRKAAKMIAGHVNTGRDAAFVTIGDPFVYSTYVYVSRILRRDFADIKIEIVPGVTAFNAAACAADLALVKADEKMAVVPVTENTEKLKWVFKEFDTVVLMKIGAKLQMLISFLKGLKLLKRAVLVSRVGYKDQRIIRNLASLRDERIGYLSVVIVKK